MARARGTSQSNESTDSPPLHAIFLHVQLKSEPISNGVVEPVLSHNFQPEYVLLMSGFDQTTVRSAGANHPFASGPTLALSGFPCNRSSVFASFATLLLLTQPLVCSPHRLNPQASPVTRLTTANSHSRPLPVPPQPATTPKTGR